MTVLGTESTFIPLHDKEPVVQNRHSQGHSQELGQLAKAWSCSLSDHCSEASCSRPLLSDSGGRDPSWKLHLRGMNALGHRLSITYVEMWCPQALYSHPYSLYLCVWLQQERPGHGQVWLRGTVDVPENCTT